MKKGMKTTPTVLSQVVEKAFKAVSQEHGVSEKDLFIAALGHCAVGLLLVNLGWMPGSFRALGWALLVAGLLVMVLIRKELCSKK